MSNSSKNSNILFILHTRSCIHHKLVQYGSQRLFHISHFSKRREASDGAIKNTKADGYTCSCTTMVQQIMNVAEFYMNYCDLLHVKF